MYRELQDRLTEHVRKHLQQHYNVELDNLGVTSPPNVEFGEFALTCCFELAKKLRKAPKKIAEEIVATIGLIEGIKSFEVAGAGYINARIDRAAFAAGKITPDPSHAAPAEKILVEHTSINPNKAAHIGHLRNAILG